MSNCSVIENVVICNFYFFDITQKLLEYQKICIPKVRGY